MFRFFRVHILVGVVLLICVGTVGSLVLSFFIPAPPTTIAIGTAFKGGAYELFGNRYKEILARSGVSVDVRVTGASGANLKLLQDTNSGVDVGFVQGGVSNSQEQPGVLSLGRVYYQPFMIFYRATETWNTVENLALLLKGRRIAVGPVGSGTQVAAAKVLGAIGINSITATFVPIFGPSALSALQEGKVDVVFYAGGIAGPVLQALLRDPQIRLANFPRADAFTRNFPFLVRLDLPQAAIDIQGNIPTTDMTIIGTTNSVLVRKDLHPDIITLLAQALIEAHREAGLFQREGEFPTLVDPEYAMSATAIEYYKNGPSVLQKYLPLWLTVHAQRAIATLLAVLAIGIPFFSTTPKLVRFLVRERTLKLYRRLRIIERQLATDLTADHCASIRTELERIDEAATAMGVPNRYSDLLFALKLHVNLMRARLATRLAEVPKPIAKAS